MALFKRRSRKASVNLALQGGGAHGAYTWGVLDALLTDETLNFEGISGTSAGAMNAICLAQGWMEGGREGARRALTRFWETVAARSPFSSGNGNGEVPSLPPALQMMLKWTEYLAPAQFNPFDLNPLRDILDEQIDFAGLRRHAPCELFIAATHANSGKLKIFRNAELSTDAILASACLPTLHHTIVIDGEPFWDGGYSANPAIFPLVHDCRSDDILLVLLAPLHYGQTPASASDIRHRLQEIAFNNTFLREMRMFAHMQQRLGSRWLSLAKLDRQLRNCRFHGISAGETLGELPFASKLTAESAFLRKLHDQGQAHGQGWLSEHRAAVGREASLDLSALFY